jgi:hypothetical protein
MLLDLSRQIASWKRSSSGASIRTAIVSSPANRRFKPGTPSSVTKGRSDTRRRW